METEIIILIILAAVALAIVVTRQLTRRNMVKKVNYMLDAIEDGELNFRFRENNNLNKSLNRIKGIIERQHIANEQDSWTQLIRILTHEIMNTLAPIVSLSDALAGNTSTEESADEKTIAEGLEIISDSSKRLMEFVVTYRQITGIAKPIRRKLDLSVIVDKTLRLNNEWFAEEGITYNVVKPNESLDVFADEIQITQVLQNLLKNAVQSGATLISIEGRKLSDDTVILKVCNNGNPIPPEIKDLIFIPFYTTKKEGTGIGLNVCRQIMRYHGGTIDLITSSPRETVFELSFN